MLWRHLVVALCIYEAVALLTGWVPTITSLCHQARRTWLGLAVVIACLAVLAWHLLLEGDT